MSPARQGALMVIYPLALILPQVVLLLVAAVTSSPPYTMTIGWPLLGVVLVMALAAALGTSLLALLFRGNPPAGWRRIVLLWTGAIFFLAVLWALAMPPGIVLEALLVKPGGVWLIASAGAFGFWQIAKTREVRQAGASI